MARPGVLLRQPGFLVALVVAVVVALGFGLVAPILPLYARSFGVGLFAVTFLVSAFSGVRLVSNLYSGVLADRIGLRRGVGYGVLVVAASSALCAVAPGYWWLLVFRGIGGFGSALFFTSLLSLVVRAVDADARGRAVGLLQGAFLFGMMIGPSVGGVLAAPLGLRWPWAIYAGFLCVAGVVALTWLPRVDAGPAEVVVSAEDEMVGTGSPRAQGLRETWQLTRELARDSAFLAALVMMAASRWSATGVRFSLIPVFGQEVVRGGEVVVGFGLTLAALTHLAVAWPAGRIADTFGRRALSAPAYLLFAVVAFVIVFATTPGVFLLALAAYGVGTGLTSVTPPAIVADVTPPERTGVSIGALNTAGDVGSVLGPLVSGFLAGELGYAWGFGASAALLAVGALVAAAMRETLPAPERATTPLERQQEATTS